MTYEEHVRAITNATRGTIGDYINAVVAAVKDGQGYAVPAYEMSWAQRVIDAENKLAWLESNLEEVEQALRSKEWI